MSDEEVDELDLPRHSESGLSDIHISDIGEAPGVNVREIQEQAGILNNVLNNYYTEHDSYVQLQRDLSDLGYSDERVDEIALGAQQERTYRIHHTDPNTGRPMPSGLSVNQLQFIAGSGVNIDDHRTTIGTDDRGRRFILDTRTRDLDGNFAKLYLPDPVEFNPLTSEQQERQTFRQELIDSIFIEEDDDTNPQSSFTRSQRTQINDLTTTYLLGNQTEDDTINFRNSIQQISGLSSVNNVELILYNYFEDVEFERQFRNNNNGRPQGLSDQQWDFIRNIDILNYNGEPILFTGEGDDQRPYFRRADGSRISIPSDTEITVYGESLYDNTLENQEVLPRQLSQNNLDNITTYINQYFNDQTIGDDQLLQGLQSVAGFDPTDPYDAQLGNLLEAKVARAVAERDFRELNGGRPSDLSELQYEFLLTHTLEDGERRYTGEIIDRVAGNDRRDGFLEYSPSGLNSMVMIPTDASIEELIDTGRYTSNLPQYRPAVPDLPEHPHQIPPPRPEVEPVPPIPGLDNQIPVIDGPPIVPGQTEPIDPVTQEPIPVPNVDEQVARYERYFNDNQELYQGFRQIYANILPVFTGISGGFFAFSIAKIRQRNTIKTIVSENEILLQQIENKLHGLQNNLDQAREQRRIAIETSAELSENVQEFQETLSEGRQELARRITETGRYAQPELMIALQQGERDLDELYRNVDATMETVEQAQEIVDSIETDLSNEESTRVVINEKLESLINIDYSILQSLTEFGPQVVSGISIGTTLGLVLSGYLFPTYVNIEDPYIKADNIEYRPSEKKIKKENDIKPPKLVNIDKFMPKEVKIESGPIEGKSIRPMTNTFTPYKQGTKPLTYSQIQEYKQTLSGNELNNLRDKFLVFADDGKNVIPLKDNCKNVVKKTDLLIQRKIRR